MQRRARTFVTSAALAVALTGAVAGCTDGSDPGDSGTGTRPGGTSTSANAPQPGKYRTLPEPCGAVGGDILRRMLPGALETADAKGPGPAGETAAGQSPSPYEGEPAVTYDTDRRSGCSWQNATSLGSRRLSVDFERVVSYDPDVSDDEQAALLYDQRAGEARLTASGTSPDGFTGDDVTTAPSGEKDGSADPDADSEGAEPDAVPSAPVSEPPPVPRTLDGIGDAAFLDDELVSVQGGQASQRKVTLIFRTANVLVTVEYSQSLTDEHHTPDAAELQEMAQALAQRLATRFDED